MVNNLNQVDLVVPKEFLRASLPTKKLALDYFFVWYQGLILRGLIYAKDTLYRWATFSAIPITFKRVFFSSNRYT